LPAISARRVWPAPDATVVLGVTAADSWVVVATVLVAAGAAKAAGNVDTAAIGSGGNGSGGSGG
jgi:hypothetical protein